MSLGVGFFQAVGPVIPSCLEVLHDPGTVVGVFYFEVPGPVVGPVDEKLDGLATDAGLVANLDIERAGAGKAIGPIFDRDNSDEEPALCIQGRLQPFFFTHLTFPRCSQKGAAHGADGQQQQPWCRLWCRKIFRKLLRFYTLFIGYLKWCFKRVYKAVVPILVQISRAVSAPQAYDFPQIVEKLEICTWQIKTTQAFSL